MEEDEVAISQVLEKLVSAVCSSTNDWSHYDWQRDCKSSASSSTSTEKRPVSSSLSSWSSSSSSEESDNEIVVGSAAGKLGKWKDVKKTAAQPPPSKPASWKGSENWSVDLSAPLLVCESTAEFKEGECYLKGVKWAPDGSCWLTSANDNSLRIYNLPDFYCRSEMAISTMTEELNKPAVKVNEGDSIYDYCWYPFMDSSQPHTCYVLTSCKDRPIHLRDAFTGQLSASYVARNHVDTLIAPFAIHCCNREGRRLYAGYNKQIRVFDLQRPGDNCLMVKSTVERSLGGQGQSGLISCFAQEPTSGSLIAAGSYDKSIGLYSTDEMMQFSVMTAHRAGVTQLAFGKSGTYLYSGARKDGDILCWDVRRPGLVVAAYRRVVTTNQRIYFDIALNGKYLISAGSDGQVSFYDLTAPFKNSEQVANNGVPVVQPVFSFLPHGDCTNGVSFHPSLPLLLTSSGQRWFDMKSLIASTSDGDDNSDASDREYSIPRSSGYKTIIRPENSVKLWQFNAVAS